MAVRLARASRQPWLPQPHLGPPICITMCPISPADSLAPRHNFPLRTIPLPIPVPTRIAIALDACRAEPSQASPKAPRLQSFPKTTGTLKWASRCDPRATPVRFMFGVTITRAVSGSTTPGTATPMAVSRTVPGAVSKSTFSIAFSMATTTRSAPSSRGVVILSRARTVPDSSTSVARIFVPPTSTPK